LLDGSVVVKEDMWCMESLLNSHQTPSL